MFQSHIYPFSALAVLTVTCLRLPLCESPFCSAPSPLWVTSSSRSVLATVSQVRPPPFLCSFISLRPSFGNPRLLSCYPHRLPNIAHHLSLGSLWVSFFTS